jgi:hypothetical protein
MAVANTIAYYETAAIMVVKSFIVSLADMRHYSSLFVRSVKLDEKKYFIPSTTGRDSMTW